jgi:hypothetical protein
MFDHTRTSPTQPLRPGNLLWHQGKIAAVVHARVGPKLFPKTCCLETTALRATPPPVAVRTQTALAIGFAGAGSSILNPFIGLKVLCSNDYGP